MGRLIHVGAWLEDLDGAQNVAEEVNATPAQVARRWLVDHDDFTRIPIVGARTREQLAENVDATSVDLSDEQWKWIMDARYREDDGLWATEGFEIPFRYWRERIVR